MKSENKIYFYGGGYNCLSNFAAYQVQYDGEVWMTAEHAYQAQKFNDSELKDRIKNCSSAYAAKLFASEHEDEVHDDWLEVNASIMQEILQAKLDQHPDIKNKLGASRDMTIIEDSDDKFWGRGPENNGENMLGKIWMELRKDINQIMS